MIQKERIQKLNNKKVKNGYYVLYWMQSAQRSHYNHALEYAILKANELQKPLIVYFGLTPNFPDSNRRHYHFMLEGLKDVKASLDEKNIKLIILINSPDQGAINLSKNASMIIVDAGYLKIERMWRENAANNIKCPLIQVETNIVVPVKSTSSKEEFAARTIRSKINKILPKFMVSLKHNATQVSYNGPDFDSHDIENIDEVINILELMIRLKKLIIFMEGHLKHLKILNTL